MPQSFCSKSSYSRTSTHARHDQKRKFPGGTGATTQATVPPTKRTPPAKRAGPAHATARAPRTSQTTHNPFTEGPYAAAANMRLFVRKLTSRHRRKVGLPDERSSRRRTQSLGHDEVSGQDSAHLEQSCSIRARNRARRRPLRPKNRRMRLPPLLHNELTPSHPVDVCECTPTAPPP